MKNLFVSSLDMSTDLTQESLPKAQSYSSLGSKRVVLTLALIFMASLAHAQQTTAGLQAIVNQIKSISFVIFLGCIVWSVIRLLMALAGNGNVMRSVISTIVIAAVWFGFDYVIGDLADHLGGVGAGSYTGK